jgi:hypothetical protein
VSEILRAVGRGDRGFGNDLIYYEGEGRITFHSGRINVSARRRNYPCYISSSAAVECLR